MLHNASSGQPTRVGPVRLARAICINRARRLTQGPNLWPQKPETGFPSRAPRRQNVSRAGAWERGAGQDVGDGLSYQQSAEPNLWWQRKSYVRLELGYERHDRSRITYCVRWQALAFTVAQHSVTSLPLVAKKKKKKKNQLKLTSKCKNETVLKRLRLSTDWRDRPSQS